MTFNLKAMKLTHQNIILMFIIGIPVLVNNTLGHQCYVCGVDSDLNCDKFDPKEEIYAKECPPSSKGCSIQTYEKSIVRSCATSKLDDCKTANEVKYCYCSKKLCNINNKPLAPSDDEDMEDVEGSGIKNVIVTSPVTEATEKKNVAQKSNATNVSFFINLLYMAFVVLYNI